ncbi:MAG: DUF3450 domain-containing protein [Hahellaceae bacterium]|nr:DUF3450 domain-containing protein [Hahellaceae bacterium]
MISDIQTTRFIPLRSVKPLYRSALLLLGVLCLSGAPSRGLANSVNEAERVLASSQSASQLAQSRIEAMDEKARARLEETLQHERQAHITVAYNRQLQSLIDDQSASLEALEASIRSVDEMERGLLPLMHDMWISLQAFVEQDSPFLKHERQTRLRQLEQMLKQADLPVAEKYRQLLQAYQIELEYGQQFESYEGLLDDPGSPHKGRQVRFVRLGRLALYYQTLDGRESAIWQPGLRRWDRLEPQINADLTQAIRIARSQSQVELLNLPLPTPPSEK